MESSPPRFPREEQIANDISAYLSKRNYLTVREVPIVSKKLDIVAFRRDSRDLVGIEVKVTNWKRALQQAMFYRLCCHKVYIALWYASAHLIDTNTLARYGFGLMLVNGNVTELWRPRQSATLHASLVRQVRSFVDRNRKDRA